MAIRPILAAVANEVVPHRRARIKAREIADRLVQAQFLDMRALSLIPTTRTEHALLRTLTPDQLRDAIHQPDLEDHWCRVQQALAPLQLPEMTGGVNPGDQRAIYYLIRHFKPRRVLEIGTHIGCSTVQIALALKHNAHAAPDNNTPTLDTVDIRDVNDPARQEWRKSKAVYSPREMVEKLACNDIVHFHVSPSIDHMQATPPHQRYDFIFLDGDHAAPTVYRELPVALNSLNPGGLILLHDYYPDLKPLFADNYLVPGPRLAVQRFQNEAARFSVFPLGDLPWPTKLGSNTTSLALVANPDDA